jgi:hypothetical protein
MAVGGGRFFFLLNLKLRDGGISSGEAERIFNFFVIMEGLLLRPLMPHQEEGCNWMVSVLTVEPKRHGVLFTDAPGLGKTTTTLATLAILREKGFLSRPCLVACPANCVNEWKKEITVAFTEKCFDVRTFKNSTTFEDMHSNTVVIISYQSMLIPFAAWMKTITKWRVIDDPKVFQRFRIVNGNMGILRPGESYNGQWDTSINNYLRKFSKRSLAASSADKNSSCASSIFDYEWGCVVMDEAQKLKDRKASTSNALAMVMSQYRIALTGTPVMNASTEITTIMRYGLGYGDGSGASDVSSDLYKRCTFGRLKNQVRLPDAPTQNAHIINVIISMDGFPWDRQLYLDRLGQTRSGAQALDEQNLFAGETPAQRARRLRVARNNFFGNTSALQLLCLHRDVYLNGGKAAPPDDGNAAAEEVILEPVPAFSLEWTFRTHQQFPLWFQRRVMSFLLSMMRVARFLTKDVHRLICTFWANMESGITQPSPKLLAMYDILKSMETRDPDDKMIVMSSSRVFLEKHVMPYFADRGVGCVLLAGMAKNAKLAAIKAFETDSNVKIMCAVKSVAGVGLNLQHTSGTMVICEPGWNDAIDSQVFARIDRTGQRRVPHIYRLLIANSVDTAIMELQAAKLQIAHSTVYKHEQVHIATILRKMIDMNPETALVPRPQDSPVTYNQGFLTSPVPVPISEPIREDPLVMAEPIAMYPFDGFHDADDPADELLPSIDGGTFLSDFEPESKRYRRDENDFWDDGCW